MNIDPDQLHTDLNALWKGLRREAERSSAEQPTATLDPAQLELNKKTTLDRNQAQAAAHFLGPIMVLAPAGAGKTRTLTARIENLVEKGVAPGQVLALAFNRKAAGEMEERLNRMGIHRVRPRTFHSLGYEIVRQGLGWRYHENSDAEYRQQVIGAVRRAWDGRYRNTDASHLAPIIAALERVKTDLIARENMEAQFGYGSLQLHDLFRQVSRLQRRDGLLTFNDMIYQALRVLVANRALRRSWQEMGRFLLVDEFQDLNRAQLLFMRILGLPQNNVFVVGDDDQMIYGWRGAQVAQMLEFESLYPKARKVILTVNYRSAGRIVRHANWLIRNNHERIEKNTLSRKGAPRGHVEVRLETTLEDQANTAGAWILDLKERFDSEWRDFGLLFRTNQEAIWLADVFTGLGIPFSVPDKKTDRVPEPADRDHVRLLTIHKAKGMEFQHVVYFNLSRSSGVEKSHAEERRVAYVAVTRAKESLLITADSNAPSGFLFEWALDPELEDFALSHLERRLRWRRICGLAASLGGGVAGWLRAFFAACLGRTPGVIPGNDAAAERLASEIRMRRSLGSRAGKRAISGDGLGVTINPWT